MPATALRLAVPSWADDDGAMAPWAVPATGGAAALVGAWATLLLAHRHASRLRFNVRTLTILRITAAMRRR